MRLIRAVIVANAQFSQLIQSRDSKSICIVDDFIANDEIVQGGQGWKLEGIQEKLRITLDSKPL